MKIYSESIPLQSAKKREAINVSSRIKAAVEKSTFRDGIAVVSSLHSDCAVVLLQDDPGILNQLDRALDHLASSEDDDLALRSAEQNPAAHIQGALLGQRVVIPFSDGRVDLGPREAAFFVELDGIRPRQVVVKILGE
ncbi:MAG TPA: secondary thiamine-phosphate synthase enzyme YjbQ [Candidatus Dormibacteraeota bacterium]|nr:secondary thiamine-phosphate synthase enzyme YjbQ [Candidatus Dormibacteraeota bacterium]